MAENFKETEEKVDEDLFVDENDEAVPVKKKFDGKKFLKDHWQKILAGAVIVAGGIAVGLTIKNGQNQNMITGDANYLLDVTDDDDDDDDDESENDD